MSSAVEQFERDGYVIFRSVVDAALMAEVREHVDWLQARHPDLRPEQLHHGLMTRDAFWVRLVSDERLLDIAQLFIGPDIALFASHYISKPAYSGQAVLWHQDGSYWPLDPMEVVTLWLSVDASTPENGCMRVIPGSHRLGIHDSRQRTDVDNVLSSETTMEVDDSSAVDFVLEPGDVSVHHPNILHGSNANTSAQRRCGLTIRYIPTSTRIVTTAPGPWAAAFLLRGQAVDGVNEYNPRPAWTAGESQQFRGSEAWV